MHTHTHTHTCTYTHSCWLRLSVDKGVNGTIIHFQEFSVGFSVCEAFLLSGYLFITCQLYFISGGKPCLSSSYLLLWADHDVFWGPEQEAGRINLNNKWRMIITNFKMCFYYFSYCCLLKGINWSDVEIVQWFKAGFLNSFPGGLICCRV